MIYLFTFLLTKLNDNEPIFTQEMVDKINNNPKSTYKVWLDPKFANLKKKDLPFLQNYKIPPKHGSPHLTGTDEKIVDSYPTFFAGYSNPSLKFEPYSFQVYDNTKHFCTSWATSVTSVMSLSLSIHSHRPINLSLQFIADCDLYGNVCAYRPPLNAYEPFYHYFIPQSDRWDEPSDITRTPPQNLTKEICESIDGCYPGWTNCPRNRVLSGSCEPSESNSNCPVYLLPNWRYMKSFLYEVGPITSILAAPYSILFYKSGVYNESRISPSDNEVRQLDFIFYCTIIGWGENKTSSGQMTDKWWYVIPHLGKNWGALSEELFPDPDEREAILGYRDEGVKTGIIRIARNHNVCDIEKNAFGAVPFNFKPKPIRTPKPTNAPRPTIDPILT